MAQIVVRNLEQAVKDWLKTRAAGHGRSMEEEVRDILRKPCSRTPNPARDWAPSLPHVLLGSGWKKTYPSGAVIGPNPPSLTE